MTSPEDEPRIDKYKTAILGSRNRLKLGVFGLNCQAGVSISLADGSPEATWDESLRLTEEADRLGIEAMIPVARWRGYGGAGNLAARCFETFTWASALAARTEAIQIFATFHVPIAHPALAAKMVSTVDHVSGGRFGLNIVAGSYVEELAMFGKLVADHDERYAYADEWTTLAKRLWTENEFDFEGRFFTAPGAFSEPKPLQAPYPVIMSAGQSPAGQRFAAKHADLIFVPVADRDSIAANVLAIKERAREETGREIRVFGRAHITCRDTEQEARRHYDYVVNERGDHEAADHLIRNLLPHSQSLDPAAVSNLVEKAIAGFFAYPLTGTPEQIVDMMLTLSDAGFDGVVISWHDYEEGIAQLGEQILPLMEQANLREPAMASSHAAPGT